MIVVVREAIEILVLLQVASPDFVLLHLLFDLSGLFSLSPLFSPQPPPQTSQFDALPFLSGPLLLSGSPGKWTEKVTFVS